LPNETKMSCRERKEQFGDLRHRREARRVERLGNERIKVHMPACIITRTYEKQVITTLAVCSIACLDDFFRNTFLLLPKLHLGNEGKKGRQPILH